MQQKTSTTSRADDTTSTGTARLVSFATQLQGGDVPAEVMHAAKRHLIDTCGAIVGGMQMDVASKIARVPGVAMQCAGGLPVPGSPLTLDAPSFAMLCGTAAHGIELDDGYREGSCHPGVTVIPATLAAATTHAASGRDLLHALIVGYEAVAAISAAAHPALRNRGFHPTSVVGPLAAALAVGRLLRLSAQDLQNALGIAASSSGGLFAFLDGGGDVKRLHAGQAARSGLLAALFAREGISGPSDIIEIASGFSQAFAYGADRDRLVFELPPKAPFRTTHCYIKPYACCRHLQPAIDALIEIMATNNLKPADIQRVDVEAYSIAASHAETGWDDFASAQLSFPYVMAVAMHHGTVDLRHFETAARNDPVIAAEAPKFHFRATAEMDALYPRQRPSRVTVEAKSGRFTAFAPEALGAPEKPVDDARLAAKFTSLVEPVLGGKRTKDALALLWTLDEASSAADLLKALTL